jgi:hypothetical protein
MKLYAIIGEVEYESFGKKSEWGTDVTLFVSKEDAIGSTGMDWDTEISYHLVEFEVVGDEEFSIAIELIPIGKV